MRRGNIITYLLLLPSVLVILVLAFYWSLLDFVTPFLIGPVEWAAWLLLLISTLISVILLFSKSRAKKFTSYLPILAFIFVALCAKFVPFTSIWLNLNFHIYRAAREKIAGDIFSGKLAPNITYNPSLIALPSGYKSLSMGGGEVVVESFDKTSGVYFFTYRGILDSSSGYLYMNSDSVPNGQDFVDARKVAPRWFYVETN